MMDAGDLENVCANCVDRQIETSDELCKELVHWARKEISPIVSPDIL